MNTHTGRIAWVDLLRGTALAGMIVYHAAWDLHAFGVATLDPGIDPGWRLLGRVVATLFLALSGFSLGLALEQGRTLAAMLRRLVRVAVAAGLVTAATWLVSPQTPIWFGILHCIVVTNLIAIVLRRSPNALLLVVAAAAWLLPSLVPGTLGAGWAWTGLADYEPATLDFRPVLPWLAPVLIGLCLGRIPIRRWAWPFSAQSHAAMPFQWAGRHSLGIYLVHQPLMLAALIAASHGAGWHLQSPQDLREPAQASAFLLQCRKDCTQSGGDDTLCRSSCDCVLTRLVRMDHAPASRRSPQQPDIASAVAACRQGDR